MEEEVRGGDMGRRSRVLDSDDGMEEEGHRRGF